MNPDELVVFVDVDDTLVSTVSGKRIPMPESIRHVRALFDSGVVLYCWSSGGGDYAKASAEELGLAHCFRGFLPKPHVMMDDEHPAKWRRLLVAHPSSFGSKTTASYMSDLNPPTAART